MPYEVKISQGATHVVSLPTMLGNSFEVYRRLQGTNGVKGEKGVDYERYN